MTSIANSLAAPLLHHSARAPSRLQRLGRKALIKQLRRLELGELTITEHGASRTFGKRDLAARIDVVHPQFWADAACGGSRRRRELHTRSLALRRARRT